MPKPTTFPTLSKTIERRIASFGYTEECFTLNGTPVIPSNFKYDNSFFRILQDFPPHTDKVWNVPPIRNSLLEITSAHMPEMAPVLQKNSNFEPFITSSDTLA